ncbi:MAG: NAD(P)-dependent alcohol dehydrogenase [Chloroflexi bacterium]|nr:NAD(P)-dependent alcohol dehydrogenase [Chloroflexota bacterium]
MPAGRSSSPSEVPAAPAPAQKMRAVVHDRYGGPDVLRLVEVERPTPGNDEVLVRIHATTVTRTDCGLRSADYVFSRLFTGLLRPKRKILGFELAGEVEAVGAAVTEFRVGDRVFGVKGFGAHAEFVCIRETAPLAHMPTGMSFDEAAAVCDGAALALACLRKADLRAGQSILVYGASGSVGTAAVQLASYYGLDVTAVCSTTSDGLVRSLGADRVIDYTQADFTKRGETYEIILDAVGKLSFWRCRGSLKPGGTYVGTDGLRNLLLAPLVRWIWKKSVTLGITRYSRQDVRFVKELIEAGRYRAVIDRRYPLEQVIEATRYVETGQKTGNVVLTVGHDQRA